MDYVIGLIERNFGLIDVTLYDKKPAETSFLRKTKFFINLSQYLGVVAISISMFHNRKHLSEMP
ncbi:MAG: hypothetical protein DCF15_17990 [Phormidesmis priestleyi]|uniref:Uncharacterized protein n=1 Tax=Phormidesmis priestleyi TaxID=268141 RepID=A0A2W4WT73_9CYAN|nr:MAG: hypothetical protein DCF15_17990 [Phormidesmis priestleyi]